MQKTLSLDVDGVDLQVSALHHEGGSASPIVFLHGFGSIKKDYADIRLYSEFDNHSFLAYDAPACGQTMCGDLSHVSIPFLRGTALAMINGVGFQRFHLEGLSMGGLTALMLAASCPDRVLTFTNIEGNIAPEDCFLSRQIDLYPASDAERFFEDFIRRTSEAPAFSSALYATSLRYKVRAAAVRGIFRSMVDLSDTGNLMERFLNLPCPKQFMYGEQSRNLSYLSHIQQRGVHLSEIPRCGHFPMYANAPAMWQAIKHLAT